MDEKEARGSDLGETLGVPGVRGGLPGPDSGSVSALRRQLALLERSRHCPISEREDHLLDVLPLFIELYQSGNAGEDLNLQLLAAQSAEMVVRSIQHRLSGKPAEEARFEVEQFFRRKAEVRASGGWLLLRCLGLLSAGDSETVETIVKSGLPAALVNCLYLFVSIPPRKEGAAEEAGPYSFQELFTQVLVQLCRQVRCVEEVVETQELQCLIIALTSLWDQCSVAWRRQASRVLRAVSAARAKNTVPALQAKHCLKICIQNLLKLPALVPGPVLAQVAVCVFSFVCDSYPGDMALLDEFESNGGYAVLEIIMSRCEEGVTEADIPTLEDFLSLIASLTLCGRAELKVAVCVNNPQPPGFKFDPILTEGSAVKNLAAFRILQSSFLRSENPHTCAQILRAVRAVWSRDKANFFLLEWSLQSLARMAECAWRKPPVVHTLFLHLLEMVVLRLSYFPHEALERVQAAAFRRRDSTPFAVATLLSFRRLCVRSGLFADVLCDSGLLELLLAELRAHAKVLRKAGRATGDGSQRSDGGCEKILVTNMLKLVAVLAQKSVKNTVSIRDYGMIPYIKIFLDEEQFRGPTLVLLEQLSVINAEEYMSITIGALCSSTQAELGLKRDLLQSVLEVLESPTSWNAFRTAGGFNGVLSLLVDMEGALRARPAGVWASPSPTGVRELVLLGLTAVALAVHLHPVNAHFFHATGQWDKMADALLQLGCFRVEVGGSAEAGSDRGTDHRPDRHPESGLNHDHNTDRQPDCNPNSNHDPKSDRNTDCRPAHDPKPVPNRDEDCQPDLNPDLDSNSDPEPISNCNTDCQHDHNPNLDWNADCQTDHKCDPNSNPDPDLIPNRDTDCQPDLYIDPDPIPDHNTDCQPDLDCDCDPDCQTGRRWTFLQLVDLAETSGAGLPPPFRDCVLLLSFLERFAVGTLVVLPIPISPEEEEEDLDVPEGSSVEPDRISPAMAESVGRSQRSAHSVSVTSGLGCRSAFDQTIVHPGAVCVIMMLLPKISSPEHPELVAELQLAVANHVQCLVKSERNRQIMCKAGLQRVLLVHFEAILVSATHPLHLPVVRVFEKLASQSIDHASLRKFLCLGNPFMCGAENHPPRIKTDAVEAPPALNGPSFDVSDDLAGQGRKPSSRKLKPSFSLLDQSMGSPVPHHRTVSLVSMTSPRSPRPPKLSVSPSFVEFDMSGSGYGCLFLPSLATVKGVSADSISTGGVGSDCRGFPPLAGLSFSCWFLIGRFSSACDSHPIRLLTVVRHMSRAEQQFICLSVTISAPDGCLVISTEEEAYQFLDLMEPEMTAPAALPSSVRFRCARHLVPNQWHHLAVTLAKDVKKSCLATAYLNGKMFGCAKMKYIQPFPGTSVSMDPTAVVDVCGIIGTPLLWKQQASLVWRTGPAYLWEEAVSPESVEVMYRQGTKYLGNYLSVSLPADGPDVAAASSPVRIIPEERISFAINPTVSCVTTVAEIRDQFNEVDYRLIANEMGIDARDNCTPVFLACNVAQHLSGTSRTIGAALVGRFGVRTFVSDSAADSFLYIGGPAAVLSLVAMATDDASLYAAAKVLLSVLSTSPRVEREMSRTEGYKLLAFLLKMKTHLITHRTFQLILAIVGTMELGSGSVSVQNLHAFRDILCDFEVWRKAPDNLDLLVLNHFDDILKSSSPDGQSAEVFHGLGVMTKLLFLLNEPTLTCHKVAVVSSILRRLLTGFFNTKDVCRLGLFLVYTLLPPSLDENSVFSGIIFDVSSRALSQTPARSVWIRNRLLEMLFNLIGPDSLLPQKSQEEVFWALGPDWFLLLAQSHLHSGTVTLALGLLIRFLSCPAILARFRDGVSPGTLLENVAEEPSGIVDGLKTQRGSPESCSCPCPGFEVLQRLLVSHVAMPEIYVLLAALLLQKNYQRTATGQADLDELLQEVIDCPHDGPGLQLCGDAALVLLELVKVIISKPSAGCEGSWETQFPGSVMQFFCLVHSLHPRDPLWSSPDFLNVLAATVFPPPHPRPTTPESSPRNGSDSGEVPPPLAPPAPHPARKQVCDFMRILLMDSLVNMAAKNKLHPFVFLLEFSPETASQEQKQAFQTEVLEHLMDIVHMSCHEEGQATHVARDEVTAGDRPEGNTITLIDNVAFFSKKLVEKLYEGMFLAEPEKILVFIAELIAVMLEKAPAWWEKTVRTLYHSANCVLLHFLSRRRQTGVELRVVARTLSVLHQQWDVLMATSNGSTNFLTCFLHCLLVLGAGSYPEGFGCETQKKPAKKMWSHLLPRKSTLPITRAETPSSAEVEAELRAQVESTWSRLMAERRHELEESHKMEVSAKLSAREGPVSLADVSPLLEETALKAWQLFIDSLKKKMAASQQKSAAALSSALRSARRKPGKTASCSVEEYLMCMEAHRRTGQETFERLLKNHVQMRCCESDGVACRWQRVEEELLRERGLFGPGPGVFLKQGWVQDAAEGPGRMRPRLRRQAPCRSKKFPVSTPCLYGKWNFIEENSGVAESSDSDSEPKILCEAGQEARENGLDCDQLTFFPSLVELSPHPDDFSQLCAETQLILQQLRPAEQVKGKLCIIIVSGHVVEEGVLLFGAAHFYICEGFTLSPAGDVCCRKHHPTSIRDSYICGMLSKTPSTAGSSCRRHAYEDVRDAHFARFLLEDNALEIFMRNGQSTFLVFQNKEHLPAFKRLCSVVPSLKGRGVTDGVRKTAGGEKAALLKWQRGEMSNFEYLMHLNTVAGRTYNDLMQYPVFPWVLADYDSPTLDLSSPATFRDLSKPMGAQTDKRKEKFIERFNEVENNDGDLSAQCHYCTHYSSAIIVASLLVRMEPFSHTFLALQGGSYDVADRMFYSVKKEWESASRNNMSDVRELIPEFYYLPDFLLNSNSIELGCLQDGTRLGDVSLPPWAKGDPQEFIRVHREALECDYVSSQLHLWIDLIFGCKQRGQAAVDAVNTFHPYFYVETLDTDALSDPLKKSTILGYISNFGQIPRQLFLKPHPPRSGHKPTLKDQSGPSHAPPFFHRLNMLKPSVQPIKELARGPVGHMVCGEKDLMVVEKNKLLIPPLWNTFFSWGFHDNTCAYGNYSTEKNFSVCESPSDWGESLCAACPNPSTIVTGGARSVLCIWDVCLGKDKLQHMRLRQVLYGHTDAVTCVEASQAYGVIVSGSSDRTCILWDLLELDYITQLPGHPGSVTALAINDMTGEIASCAGEHLYLWTMTGQLLSSLDTTFGPGGAIQCCCFAQACEWDPRNVVVTGCADGIVRVWKMEYTSAPLAPDRGGCTGPPTTPGAPHPVAPETAGGVGAGWERHLVLCQELNRSLAATRRRYRSNPPVTALAVSRDHSSLFVGDAWGRVFSWTCEG